MTSLFDLVIYGPNPSTQVVVVHRCILKARVPLLYEELRQKWRPATTSSSTSTTTSTMTNSDRSTTTTRKFQVNLADCPDWVAFRNTIRFLYSEDLPLNNTPPSPPPLPSTSTTATTTSTTTTTTPSSSSSAEYFNMLKNIKELARRYQIERLEKLCAFKMGDIIEVPDCHLSSNLRSIFNRADDETVDVTLRVNGGRLSVPAHKAILVTRCPYFRGMFQSGMIESEKNEVDIPEETTEKAFLQLIEYLYCDEIRELDGETAMEVYALANRYGLDHLQNYCMTVICESIDESNVEEVKKWADTFGNHNLRYFCEDRMRASGATSSSTNNAENEASNR